MANTREAFTCVFGKVLFLFSKNLKMAAGKTQVEFVMWLTWFLPHRPNEASAEPKFPGNQFILLSGAFQVGGGVSAENGKEGSLLGDR